MRAYVELKLKKRLYYFRSRVFYTEGEIIWVLR